jgi:hypothetical protein
VRKERVATNSKRLYGIPLDNTYGSLQNFCEALFFQTLMQRHNEAKDDDHHLRLHQPFVIAYGIDSDVQSLSGSPGIFMAVSSLWMLLNIGRALNSGWEMQLQVDATFKVCTEAVGVLGFGVNSLGAHMNLVCTALIPDNRESEEMMKETWNAIRRAFHLLLTRYKRCPIHDCMPCMAFQAVHDGAAVQELLGDDDFTTRKKIPVGKAGSDNSAAFQNFARNVLEIPASQCFSHLTGESVVVLFIPLR